VAICWDQWFPETARSMALMGAELLFYPTAIGSEPHDASITSRDHWQRVQQGHAGANLVPLIASNRIGREDQDGSAITFYGASFIANAFGEKVEELSQNEEGVRVHRGGKAGLVGAVQAGVAGDAPWSSRKSAAGASPRIIAACNSVQPAPSVAWHC
jgi:predicted amidohydrolase